MSEIKLLDCTLRDGGYKNDWEFGHNNIISIMDRLDQAGVDIIEIGFIDEIRPFDINRTIMPNTESVKKILGNNEYSAMLVGMIDYGTCKIENIKPASESMLDGIRVIFKKHLMHEAMDFCAQVKARGYKVFSQMVSITSYNDDELMELIELVNKVKPYAVSMVDTYGLLHPNDMLHYYEILDEHVDSAIWIGFHAHNNFQLAYANDIAFLDKPAKHDIVIDATLFGMGKSAGNSQIELVSMYLNDQFNKNYKINYLLESIEETIMGFYNKTPWGYNLFYYLCSKNKCHPNYVNTFLKKENLSLTALDDVLSRINPESKKLLYDQNTADKIYDDFEDEINDEAAYKALSSEFAGKNILVIGPGKNVSLQEDKIKNHIEKNHPVVISINYIPKNINVNYIFVTNKKRNQQLTDSLREHKNSNVKLIATSNITAGKIPFSYQLKNSDLLANDELYSDNSFIMLVKVLKKCGVTKISCAGLDGYSNKGENYINPKMEYAFVKAQADYLNKVIKFELFEKNSDITFEFITYSKYTEKENCNDAKF